MKYCYRCGKDKPRTDFRRIYNREGRCLNRMAICGDCEELYTPKKRRPRTGMRRAKELAMLGNPFEKAPVENIEINHFLLPEVL